MEQHRVSDAALRTALDEVVLESLRPVTIGIGLLYVVIAGTLLASPTADGIGPLVGLRLLAAAMFIGAHFALRWRPLAVRWAQSAAAVIALVIFLNLWFNVAAFPDPHKSANVAVYVIGIGCFFLSRTLLIIFITATIAVWIQAAWFIAPGPDWADYVMILLAASAVSYLVHDLRVRTYTRFHRLRIEDETIRVELQQTVEALEESRLFSQQLSDCAPFLMYVYDWQKGRVTYLNSQFAALLGYPPEKIQSLGDRAISELIHPDDRELIANRHAWEHLFRERGEEIVERKFRLKHANGEWRWFNSQEVVFHRTPQGSPRSLLGTAHDVTDRLRTEQALQTIAEGTSSVVGSQFLVSLVKHLAHTLDVEYVSVCEYLESERKRVRIRAAWHGDQPGVTGEMPITGTPCELASEGRPLLIADGLRQQFPDHQSLADMRAESFCAIPLTDSIGHLLGHLAIVDTKPMNEPLTQIPAVRIFASRTAAELQRQRAEEVRLESEQRFRLMADSSPVMIWSADPQLKCTYVSKGWLEFTGRLFEQELGDGWTESIHPDDRKATCKEISERCSRRERFVMQFRVLNRTGEYRWVIDQGSPRFTPDGEFVGYVGSVLDITDRIRAEKELSYRMRFDAIITQISTQFINLDFHRIDAAVDEALKTIGEFVGVQRAYICRVHGDPPLTTMIHEWCAEGVSSNLSRVHNVPLEDFQWAWERIKRLESIQISDVSALPPESETTKQFLAAGGVRAFIAVPLTSGNSLWGYLGFSKLESPHEWTHDVVSLLKVVGEMFLNTLERKQAEEALRESEARFRVIFDNAAVGIGLVSAGVLGRIVQCNSALERILGYEPGELIDKELSELTHPDDLNESLQMRQELIGDQRTSFQIEKRYRHKSSKIVWARLTGSLVRDSEGTPIYAIGIVEDITERKLAEEALRASEIRYQTLMNSAGDAIFVADADSGMLVDANQVAQQVSGRTLDELRRIPLRELCSNDDPERISALMHNGTAKGESSELELIDRQGGRTPMEVSSTIIQVNGQRLALGIFRNISERKRAEDKIRQLNQDLAHASRLSLMGEMAAGLAHELHQPLAVIANYSQGCIRRLQRGPLETAELIERLKEVTDETIRAGDVIRRIRRFIQKRELERQQVEFQNILDDALRLARVEIRQHRVNVRANDSSELPPVHADPIQITQVLLNLILNAIQAMSAGDESAKRQLTIRAEAVDSSFVEVSVADSGPGILVEPQQKIFEQFFTTKPEGLGMGLAIGRSVIEAHGGRLWVQSTPGAGSAFHFTLPVHSQRNQEQRGLEKPGASRSNRVVGESKSPAGAPPQKLQ